MGLQLLYTELVTGGSRAMDTSFMIRLWQAGRHVEMLASTRFTFAEPTEEGAEMQFEEAVARWETGPSGQPVPHFATAPLAPCPSKHFLTITADDFVLLLVAMYSCSRVMRAAMPAAFHTAFNLWAYVAARDRIRAELLPELAARTAGQPWAMGVEQLEAVCGTLCAITLEQGLMEGLADPAHGSFKQARTAYLYAAAERLMELAPHCGPLTLRPLMEAVGSYGQPWEMCSVASRMAAQGEAEGNDLAVLVGAATHLAAALGGLLLGGPDPYGRNPYPLAELRQMYGKMVAAERRLERWNMRCTVSGQAHDCILIAKEGMALFAAQPDTALVTLPARPGLANALARTLRGGGSASANAGAAQPRPSPSGASAPPSAAAAGAASGTAAPAAALAPGEQMCDGCRRGFLVTRRCGQCRRRRYCSQACQAKDWRAGHKAECKRLAVEAEKEAEAGAGATEGLEAAEGPKGAEATGAEGPNGAEAEGAAAVE
ncbi:hypothetical protein HYH02_006257 [Chlamydomonas schloesseri]|uniref:MYND-type domain-containing protein n=1 Tax=Chlamydomonas schloesseri TaxID=2026947 RepID=A0A835WKG7_9CHLO|nr:hypothetical protein HYH02_006257 [Chlamydomonas schloesseri]|eukprot:KAG2448909.1 hypothetical protein HYH02_006257 [Chlamydomonas schloesseri]